MKNVCSGSAQVTPQLTKSVKKYLRGVESEFRTAKSVDDFEGIMNQLSLVNLYNEEANDSQISRTVNDDIVTVKKCIKNS